MNKIIPFTKEIKFNDEIGEITSIVVEDNLKFDDEYTIIGDLIIKGNHKYGDIEEEFSYSIPTTISVDEKYDTHESKIMVDDFYYEIVNNDTLKVKIDLLLDNLSFKKEQINPIVEEIKLDEKEIEEKESVTDDNTIDLFKEINDSEKEYTIYRVYVVKEGDTLSKILEKYNLTSEELSHYNDLDNLKPGIKLIIPSTDE